MFDAYGTLFDVHGAVRRHEAAVGPDAAKLSDIWRTKQLEYAFVRSLSGRYRDFEALTAEALDTAFAMVPSADRSLREALLDAYRTLAPYPDARPLLEHLKAGGHSLAILSNGSPGMLADAVGAAGFEPLFDCVLSVDTIHRYKPDPAVYEMVTKHFGVGRPEISFQSSNRWDIAGASRFGFRTNWINRSGAPDEYPDLKPDAVLTSLADLMPGK
ncbi:haloacid dehalogenase type II [Hartmannibacter diazotrophicus]|uniref:haloacid dehalogenase type II n=1 Tax=Hartmannibacter diazotrophicus TaxID=1482074 RepID=UPI0031841CAB